MTSQPGRPAEYTPLDLARYANAAIDVVSRGRPTTPGSQTFQGLPFLIAGAGERARGIGYGAGEAPIVIEIGHAARHVIVAHIVLESHLESGGVVGETVATYRFTYVDGAAVDVPIRERFEIGSVPPADEEQLPALPFLAVPDTKSSLVTRDDGPWSLAGRRQTEISGGAPSPFVLFAWASPRPDVEIASLTVIPALTPAVIGAVTLGHLDEWPFVRTGARAIRIDLLGAAAAARPFDLALEVDRGTAGFPYPLPLPGAEALAGWGSLRNDGSSPAYVRVAAIPSATLSLRQGGTEIGRARWGDVERNGRVETDRVRVELADPGRNWVRTAVVDESGRPVPCRISFRSAEGIPHQPHGHHDHLYGDQGTWHLDVGGDVRLGQHTYAYIDGTCEGWLPRGEVIVEAARGFEHEPLVERVRIEPGQQRLELRLRRSRDMNAEGWYSGDTHVHFLSSAGGHLEARGEDLNVVNVLQAQWGHLFTNTEDFTGEPSVSRDGRSIVHISQENRQHFMGHMSLLGLRRPVMPWSSDGPSESEAGGTLETLLSHWADECHAQGGTVVLPHFPKPNGEHAALIAMGRADAVEMIRLREFNHTEYYRYLNAGYRMPLAGGTDKMSSEVPVGLYRTYVRIPPDEGFTHETWLRNLARGRTFLSAGPLIRFQVDGHEIGDTVALPAAGGTVEVNAEVTSIFPVQRLELVHDGRVVAAATDRAGAGSLRLRERIHIERNGWLAVRAGSDDYFGSPLRHFDTWRRGIFAHSSPIYVACGGEWGMFDRANVTYMLTLVEGARSYVRNVAAHDPPGTVTHRHGEADHLAFLDRPLADADARLRERLAAGR